MNEETPSIDAVFVYGTLKRGQCREILWPESPRRVIDCLTQGVLFGRQDYPAMVSGTTPVRGELWQFRIDQMQRVLRVLDQIEGTDGNSVGDLYHRHVVEVTAADGTRLGRAFAYFYNRNAVEDGFVAVPLVDGVQQWPHD